MTDTPRLIEYLQRCLLFTAKMVIPVNYYLNLYLSNVGAVSSIELHEIQAQLQIKSSGHQNIYQMSSTLGIKFRVFIITSSCTVCLIFLDLEALQMPINCLHNGLFIMTTLRIMATLRRSSNGTKQYTKHFKDNDRTSIFNSINMP